MGLFNDPLARRELSGQARRWQTYAARALVALAMLAAVYHIDKRASYMGVSLSALASTAREAFTGYFMCLMILVPLTAAASAADAITKELRGGTLGLLFLTSLTPWRIAAGKWKAAMAQALLILVGGAPIAAICVYLGGVEPGELLWAAALPAASAAFAAAVALFYSTVFRGPMLALIVSILTLIAGVLAPVFLTSQDRRSLELLADIHPYYAALARVAGLPGGSWINASLFSLFVSVLVVAAAAARLPGRLHVVPGPGPLSRLMERLDAFFERLNRGRRRFFVGSGEVWEERALLWKELRVRAGGRLRHASRIALALLLVAALPLLAADQGMLDWIGVFFWLFAGLLTLQAVVAGVGLFVHEREGRQWDVLLATPLSSEEILGCKLIGGLASLAPTSAVFVLYVSVIAAFTNSGAELWWGLLPPIGLFALFAFLLSAGASLRARTPRGAFGSATGVLLGILLGLPLLGGILDLGNVRAIMAWTNPGFYLSWASERLRNWGYGSSYYEHVSLGEPLVMFGVLYAAACAALFARMRAKFDVLAGRA